MTTRPVHTATLRGEPYRITFGRLDGYCDQPESNDKYYREIFIDLRQGPRDTLETIVHECIHAEFPDATEDEVTRAGRNIARLLWRLGYRIERAKDG